MADNITHLVPPTTDDLPEPGPAEPTPFPPPRRGRGRARTEPQHHMSEEVIDNIDLKNLLLEYGPLLEELEDDEETKAKRKRLRGVKKAIKALAADSLQLKANIRYRVGGTGYVLEPKEHPAATVQHDRSIEIKIHTIE